MGDCDSYKDEFVKAIFLYAPQELYTILLHSPVLRNYLIC